MCDRNSIASNVIATWMPPTRDRPYQFPNPTTAPLPFRSPLHGFNPRSHYEIDGRTGFGLVRSYERVGFVVGFGGGNAPYKSGNRTEITVSAIE